MAKEDWKTIDAQGLVNALGQDKGEQVWGLFQVSKEAYRAYMNERKEFELAMQEAFANKMPTGMELKFGYMFGKLSIAVGPVSERKAQPKGESESLGDWLQAQAQSGQRC
jgi:hypothetical protein